MQCPVFNILFRSPFHTGEQKWKQTDTASESQLVHFLLRLWLYDQTENTSKVFYNCFYKSCSADVFIMLFLKDCLRAVNKHQPILKFQ